MEAKSNDAGGCFRITLAGTGFSAAQNDFFQLFISKYK
jgi:hypothetical protein